jgi:glutaredoxin
MDQLLAVTVYSRPGCHLCDEMRAVVDLVARRVPCTIDVIDISNDPQLEARYGVEVPVLVVNGRKAAKYRITEDELWRVLKARGREPRDCD